MATTFGGDGPDRDGAGDAFDFSELGDLDYEIGSAHQAIGEAIERGLDAILSKLRDLPDEATLQELMIAADVIHMKGVDLSWVDLHGEDLSGIDFEGSDFTGSNLTNVNFIGANLKNCRLEGAELVGANFDGANLEGTVIEGNTTQIVHPRPTAY